MKLITVVVTDRRVKELEVCLVSLAKCDRPRNWEIFVVGNGSPFSERTQVLDFYSNKLPLKVLEIGQAMPPPMARNRALDNIPEGTWVHFLDDDATIASDIYKNFERLSRDHSQNRVFGGPNLIPEIQSKDEFARVQDRILGSLWGAGPFYRRYTIAPAHKTSSDVSFILCNLFVLKNSFSYFSARMPFGEENDLLREILHQDSAPAKAHYDSSLVTYHQRRVGWAALWSQMDRYGWGRGLLILKRKPQWRLALSVSLLAGMSLLPLYAAIYIVLATFRSFIWKERFLLCLKLQTVIHAGYVWGLFRTLFFNAQHLKGVTVPVAEAELLNLKAQTP